MFMLNVHVQCVLSFSTFNSSLFVFSYLHAWPFCPEHHRELQDLRAAHADTINELEKTRRLLQLQHNINKDYKNEVCICSCSFINWSN